MQKENFPWEKYRNSEDIELSYQFLPATTIRHVLAAHFVKDCPHIVELGGFKVPTTHYLTHIPKSITVIDPKTDPYSSETLHGQPCKVRHIAAMISEVNEKWQPGTYGLVMLAMSLKFSKTDPSDKIRTMGKIIELAKNAKICVIEYIVEWPNSQENLRDILSAVPHEILLNSVMDFPKEFHPDINFPKRGFVVFKPKK